MCCSPYSADACCHTAVVLLNSLEDCVSSLLIRYVLVAACVWFFLLAVLMTAVSHKRISPVVTVLLLVQQIAVIGNQSVSVVPELAPAKTVFYILNFLNFDVQLAKIGCTVPVMTFTEYAQF